jgi:hypothetical protein
LAPILAVVCLAGVASGKAWVRAPIAEVDAYHALMAKAAAGIPYSVEDWVGTDSDVPLAARALLKPNAMVSRRYTRVGAGESASLLFVQCRDASDLLGHFPPICYPAHGFVLVSTEDRDWLVGERAVHGKRYKLQRKDRGGQDGIVVDNFMILPDGSIARDMDRVTVSAQDVRQRYFGAAQIQVLTDEGMAPERRDAVFRTLVEGCLPAIRSMHAGVDTE